MRDEYDFSIGVRGKHYKQYRKGHRIKIKKKDRSIEEHCYTEEDGSIMLDPDVRKYFPNSESVNKVLQEYITHL